MKTRYFLIALLLTLPILKAEAKRQTLHCNFNPVLGGDLSYGSFSLEERDDQVTVQLRTFSGDDFGGPGTTRQSGKIVVQSESRPDFSTLYSNESVGLQIVLFLFASSDTEARALISGRFQNQENKATSNFSGQFICH